MQAPLCRECHRCVADQLNGHPGLLALKRGEAYLGNDFVQQPSYKVVEALLAKVAALEGNKMIVTLRPGKPSLDLRIAEDGDWDCAIGLGEAWVKVRRELALAELMTAVLSGGTLIVRQQAMGNPRSRVYGFQLGGGKCVPVVPPARSGRIMGEAVEYAVLPLD